MKEETKKTLAQVSTATLTLQLLKRGIRNTYMSGVAPLGPMVERLVGEAVTLRFIPMREDLSTRHSRTITIRNGSPSTPYRRARS